jgi:hypothetical protein
VSRELETKYKTVEVKCSCGKPVQFTITNRVGPFDVLSDKAFEKSGAVLATKSLTYCVHELATRDIAPVSITIDKTISV